MRGATVLAIASLLYLQGLASPALSARKKAPKPAPDITILFFTASWCEPCRAVDPVLEKFARKHERSVKLLAIDFDQAREEAARWDVREIPVVIVVSDQGKILLRCDGASRETLRTLESALEDLARRRRERS